jgi:hypothetical protein
MGTDALLSSGVTEKMLYLIRDPRAISPNDPLRQVRRSRIALFVLIELIGFGATFAITQVSCLRRHDSARRLTADHRGDRFSNHHHVARSRSYMAHPTLTVHHRRA